MMAAIVQAAGGLGLFLLGMSVMTDGLKAVADERLRSILARSTKGPLSGIFAGAITTAMVQSSSATTVAAVGFVHSGLLTFSESLGIIFGANIGTTITGWLVALIGFKLKLGEVVLPIILVGALLRLTAKGRLQSIGTALAGFGLIFVGITALQRGMSVFEGSVTPESFPPDTLVGRLLLVLMGVAITLVTQSSSAGVATALTAVHSGTISLAQAAAMVIGMDIGTTVTAAIATIGGNVQARRTGFAHVIYNAITAAGALLLLTPYLVLIDRLWPKQVAPEIALVGFHTFFNIVGVLTILPFRRPFVRLIERLFPERGNPLVRRLDAGLRESPDVALDVVMATLQEITQSICRVILPTLRQPRQSDEAAKKVGQTPRGYRKTPTNTTAGSESAPLKPVPSLQGFDTRNLLSDIDDAIDQTREYLERVRVDPDHAEALGSYSRAVHILDHLHRIARRTRDSKRLARVRADAELSEMTDKLSESVSSLSTADYPIAGDVESTVQQINQQLKSAMRAYRIHTLRRTAAGKFPTRTAMQRMDTARCIRRIGYHMWRIADHASSAPAKREVGAID